MNAKTLKNEELSFVRDNSFVALKKETKMFFINPKIDFAFKKIFGSEDSKDILISFLNALIYDAQPVIQDLEILNPYLAPKIRGMKDTYLDIKAKIIGGTHPEGNRDNEPSTVIIEMQVLNIEGFEKRILYNAAKSYSTQLQLGQRYNLLNPVIALTITDFIMFKELNNVTSRFILKEKDFLINYPIYDIELIFVELPKFQKNLTELETIIDKWLYFLNNARGLQEIPTEMEYIPEINKAFHIANQINLTAEELDDQEKSEFFIHDQRRANTRAVNEAVKKAVAEAVVKATQESLEQGKQEGLEQGKQEGLEQGKQEGLEQGKQEGLEQGKQEGLEQGKQEKAFEVAKRLLNVLDRQTISNITGLTLEELRSLEGDSGVNNEP
jgi:predicted transposase/invertase (TIGR01784 family)